ncbi:MAG TPA: SEC-C metal-binding domain-containing protein, partial [Bryobacteraceae bacterium]|nr:SEC-C metal-binding domain-containing protein [Bryobacteraceae bacterium]
TLLEKQQKSVDRARAQSHNILRKSMAELRKLQTERQIRLQLEIDEPSGLADTRQILNAMKLNEAICGSDQQEHPEEQSESAESLQDFEEMLRRELMITDADEAQYPRIHPPKAASSFCKPAAPAPALSRSLPRNKPCPCGSGLKYKKCCGGPAVHEVTQAA